MAPPTGVVSWADRANPTEVIMGITRFKDRVTGKDGPVSGAIIVIPVSFAAMLTNVSQYWSWSPPAGMKIELISIDVRSGAVTSDPALTVGITKAGTQLVAAVNVTTNLGVLTLKATEVTSGDILDVRIVTDTGDAVADGASATITAYVSAPPTASLTRGDQGHF
jgi:hypothetical protein